MKNKGALVLSGVVVALGLYAYFGEYKREINETTQKEIDSKIIGLKKDQIQKIELKKGTGVQIVLERTVDGWDLLNPLQDQADNEVIESFLDQITSEKAVDQITPQDPNNLAEYGFKPSLGTVTLVNNSNQREQIEISSKKNFEGLVFLRKDQEKKILTSSQTWTTFLSKPVDQFRDLRLFRGSISKVNVIRLSNPKGNMEFRYTDGFWFSPQRTDWKIDQNAVREILTGATSSKGTAVIAENKPFGPVGAHLVTLEFTSGKDNWKGLLHQDTKTKDVIAALSPVRMIVRFPPQTLEDLKNKKLVDFRDKTEPFHFERNEVHRIVAKTKVKSFILVKKNEVWYLEKEDPDVVINSTKAQELITKLSKLTTYRFLETPVPKMTLDSQVQLFDEANKLVFQMSWGEFKNHEAFAQTSQYKEVFQMDDAQINQLALHEVVKAKPSAEEKVLEQKEESNEKN